MVENSRIICAAHAGFCHGVARAVDTARAQCEGGIPEGCRVYTLGQLINNRHVTGELAERGVVVISEEELDGIIASSDDYAMTTVISRAHGIRREVSEKLSEAAKTYAGRFRFIDCTCPNVARIHRIVDRESHGRHTIIIGHKGHPEVVGILSFAHSGADVCRDHDELKALLEGENAPRLPILMVAQTTGSLRIWEFSVNFLKTVYTEALVYDTICVVTESRQAEADRLSRNVELMLVIGDPESSNTNRLYEICKANQPETYLIQSCGELRSVLTTAAKYPKVGITAGASTPSAIILEVLETMDQENRIIEAATAESESFADMLEDSLKTLSNGDTVKGIITSVSANEIHVDLGTKVTGIIPQSELPDDLEGDVEDVYKVGDEIEAIVVKVSDLDGVATLSRKRIDTIISWRAICNAYNNDEILEGKIVEVVKSGVIIVLNSIRVFIPASHSGLPRDADLSTLVGTVQRVKIIDLNEQRRRAVASIRAVLREERKAKEEEFWKNIEVGKRYDGVVKSLTSFGAFVDLGGVDGMVHSTELSWTRIKDPSEVVSIGEKVNVYVKDFDPERKRISLGYKTEETNPWNIFTSKYSIGDTAPVKIVSLMTFGAFAEVVPGVDGLIHISQITDHRINQPSEILEVGQEVNVKITDIDYEKHKISLSIRALLEAPAVTEDADESGTVVGAAVAGAAVTEEAAEEGAEEGAEEDKDE